MKISDCGLKKIEDAIKSVESICDCVSLREDGSCRGLVVDCQWHEGCSFYKDEMLDELSKARWAKRLSSLSEAKQNRISRKYYSGARPWEGWVK